MRRLGDMAEALGKKAQAKLQRQVSGTRTRFKDDLFDLDLTYITPRLIAMGFPGDGVQGLVRNSVDDVANFFQTYHPDSFKIWNLTDQTYDYTKFDNRVMDFSFPDHTTAPMEQLVAAARSIDAWLAADPEHVAAVHCLAGKGRAGCVCSAYLLYAGLEPTAKAAMAAFEERRGQGVEAPSQRRSLLHLEQCLRAPGVPPKLPPPNVLILRGLYVHGVPKLKPKSVSVCIKRYACEEIEGRGVRATDGVLYTSTDTGAVVQCEGDLMSLTVAVVLEGDFLIQFFHRGLTSDISQRLGVTKAEVARLSLHTGFIDNVEAPLVVPKPELDEAFRHPKLPEAFRLELRFEGCAPGLDPPRPSPPRPAARISDSDEDDGASVSSSGSSAKECAVCFDKPRTARLPCGHCTLCKRCVSKVQKQFGRCPVCEAPFTTWTGHDTEPDSTYVRKEA